jgi:hypothetical protein
MEDVVKPDGSLRQWEDGPLDRAPLRCKRAFETMIQNLKPMPQFTQGSKKNTVYLEDRARAKISEYQVPVQMTAEAII